MNINIEPYSFPLKFPFVITGYTFTDANTIRVTLHKDGHTGVGEAIGIYYEKERPESMTSMLKIVLHDRISHEEINDGDPILLEVKTLFGRCSIIDSFKIFFETPFLFL